MSWEYLHTPGFQRDLFVQIVGVFINLVLLSMLVPIGFWLYKRFVSWPRCLQAKTDGLLLLNQIADKIIALLDVNVQDDSLGALAHGELKQVFCHVIYGNLSDKLFILRKHIDDGSLQTRISMLDTKQTELLIKASRNWQNELYRLESRFMSFAKIPEAFHDLKFHLDNVRSDLTLLLHVIKDREIFIESVFVGLQHVIDEIYRLFERDKHSIDRAVTLLNRFGISMRLLWLLGRWPWGLVSGRSHRENQKRRQFFDRVHSGEPISLEELMAHVEDKASAAAVREAVLQGLRDTDNS